MDFNATIDLIVKDLNEAREIIDDLKKYPGVPVLQVELAKAKCKSAGEVISLLKNQDDIKKDVTAEPIHQPQKQKLQEEKKLPDKSDKVSAPPQEKKKEVLTVEPPPPLTEMKAEPEIFTIEVTESTIIADKFSYLSNSFNEQLGTLKSDEDVSDMLKSKPLTSLSEAIGVNDRFLFIREVFDGNNEAYSQAITLLDNAESIVEARAVIMSYAGDKNENEAVKQLLDLVKRKLPANE
jgi:hypothetical protein